jgi:4-hydroxy-tetrahydrodipicolinate synthase
MTLPFTGSGVALVTPFDESGVNERVLLDLVELHISEGTNALIICGSTGEAATMTSDEQAQAIAVVAEAAAGRIPVIAGIGGSDTASVSQLARNAEREGADGLLFSPPPYNKPSQKGIVAHYRAVMDTVDLPVIVYNVPGRTVCNILPETMEELAADSRVVGVKEASGDISQVAELCRRLSSRLAIYSGNDDQVIPILALGGRGVISVLANIAPRAVARMVELYLAGEVEEARSIQFRYLPLIQLLFKEPNPVPVKAAVRSMGYEVGGVRLPLLDVGDEMMRLVKAEMQVVGVEDRVTV